MGRRRFETLGQWQRNLVAVVGMVFVLAVAAQCGREKLPVSGGIRATGGHTGEGGGGGAAGSVGIRIGVNGGNGGSAQSCGAAGETAQLLPPPSLSTPNFVGLGTAAVAPPPVSGGTLLVLRDGTTAVVSDPDRDLVYVVDLADIGNPTLRGTLALTAGDEPGRLIEDAAGNVHVVLRKAGALVTLDPRTVGGTMRRAVCASPRGIAYDNATDRLHVACAGGQLVTFTAGGAKPERTVELGADLRDVIVDGAQLLVTRFRSAEVLVVKSDGTVLERISPPPLTDMVVHSGTPFDASVAWRMVARPGGGAAMVHQRGMKGTVDRRPGGYGGPGCDAIVHTAVTVVKSGATPVAGPAIAGMILPVDIALSSDGVKVAMVAAGNGRAQFARKVFVGSLNDVSLAWSGCGNDGKHGPPSRSCGPSIVGAGGGRGMSMGGSAGTGGASSVGGRTGAGGAGGAGGGAGGRAATPAATTAAVCNDVPTGVEPTAVAFLGSSTVLVQTREPAQLWVLHQVDALSNTNIPFPSSLTLSTVSRGDIGHAVFHSNSGGGLACASCHPEGHEDGRVWTFQCEGARRTQEIGGGLSGTEPFHWKGDLHNFSTLVDTVFVGRMSGPQLTPQQTAAALGWIDSIPARPAIHDSTDPAVARGRALFGDPTVGCATCHAGVLLTNNTTVDVGTRGMFQVPSLRGIAWRAPYMHDGCAPDLLARFGAGYCGGGDAHGKTSHLSAAELADLVAYLESL